MTVIQHQAILLDNSLATARPNPNKKERLEHYAQIAFPPVAQADLIAALTAVANGIPLSNLHLPVVRNADRKNAKNVSTTIAGIPGDWFILRVSTSPEYPPACIDENGTVLSHPAQINAVFYAGRKIMADVWFKLSAQHQKGQTIYANIAGVIAQDQGERLAIGRNTVGDLQRYANPNAQPSVAPGVNAATVAIPPAANANPFAATQASAPQPATATINANPFAVNTGATAPSANPFRPAQ